MLIYKVVKSNIIFNQNLIKERDAMFFRSLLILTVTCFINVIASASTNITDSEPLEGISKLSINFIEPSEEFVSSYFDKLKNNDDVVIISLLFKETLEINPRYSFSIYRTTLQRLKEISSLDYLENKKALEHLMYKTLKDLDEVTSDIALVEVNTDKPLTCLCASSGSCGNDSSEAESCKAENDQSVKTAVALGGLAYATQSEDGVRYEGISASYDSDLAATWAAREEFDMVNAGRVTANQSTMKINWSGGVLSVSATNPYEQMNVHKAYGYGLSGQGVTVAIMDSDLCYIAGDADRTHQDLKSTSKVTTFGSYTESYYTNKDDKSIHGCHVATTVVGDYNNNDTSAAIRAEIAGHYDPFDTDGSGEASTFDPNYSTMGVAYNSKLHFADFGLSFSGGDHELAIEDAKAKGAKVHSNSWGWSGDPTTTTVLNTSGDNNYAKFTNWWNGGGSSLTEAETTSYIDALNQFQETGVIVWALSNTTAGKSTLYGGATNQSDLSASLPTLFPQLSEAWISVSNVISRDDGAKILNSTPCGETAIYCLAHDGYNITAGSDVVDGGSDDGSWYATLNGTSMATPQVAGAAALLWEAFPDNNPEVITKRLLLTADNTWFDTDVCFSDTDLSGQFSSGDNFSVSCGGTTGTLTYNGISHDYSSLYGHGTPDLYAALQPIGTKSVSFNKKTYAFIGSGLLLANYFGDSLFMTGETGLYRDQLNGGFKFNLSDLVGRNTRNEVHRKLRNGTHAVWSPMSNNQGLNFSYSHETDINNNGLMDDSGFYSSFVSGKNTIYVGQKYSVDHALGLRDGNNAMSVLTAHNSNESFLSFTESASSGNLIGSKIDLDNSLSFNVMAYNGVHSDYGLKEKGFLASVKHSSNRNSDFSIFVGQNSESEGLLRTSGKGAFGNFASDTFHMGTAFNKRLANNVHLAGLFNYGLVSSKGDNAGFLTDTSDLKTSQFNIGMVVSGLGKNSNLLSLNLSQPLRIESGFTNLTIPGRLDSNGNVTHTSKRLSLEPSGRELNLDLGYEMKLRNGAFRIGSQMMFDALHMERNNTETVYGIFKTSF